MTYTRNILLLLSFSLLTACNQGIVASSDVVSGQENLSSGSEVDEITDGEILGEDFGIQDGMLTSVKSYCSDLSFSGVTWNKKLSGYERRSLAIALSLSGSFEGSSGWQNLTNNFDGMGMSAGLLNQTLGTGSLQPLLANLRERNPTVYNYFKSTRKDSILGMVDRWETAKGYRVPLLASKILADEEVTSSQLDMPESTNDMQFSGKLSVMAAAEDASVSWAKANLYLSSGSFKTEWKTEMKSLLGHPAYVSEQISAAEVLHRRALGYVQRLGMSSLRAYLFMFDITVQNGGLKDSEFTELATAIKNEKLTSETVILKRLLTIRLRRVLSQWRSDVQSRKTAIIDGTGAVHGSNRNLPKQYCYAQTDAIVGN